MNTSFDQNSTIVGLAVRNQANLTAFSALPHAPVQPYAPRRRRLASLSRQVRAVRRQRPEHTVRRPARRPVAARPTAT